MGHYIGTPCCDTAISKGEWKENLEEGNCSVCGTELDKDGTPQY